MANSSKQPQNVEPETPAEVVERDYYLPDYNVSVKASSPDEAVKKARKLTGTDNGL
jgi:hypothetical protein